MASDKQQYAAKLREIANRFSRMEENTIRRTMAMLIDVRKSIAAELTIAENYRAYQLTELTRSMDRLIAEFEDRMGAEMRAAMHQAQLDGTMSVIEPLQIVDQAVFFQPTAAQANVLLDYSADLVQNIGNDMRSKINTQVRLAALGQETPVQAMKRVTDALGIEAQAGRWKRRKGPAKGIAARAETVVRTELNRAYNLSNHSAQQQVSQQIPGLLKVWTARGDGSTRPSHLLAHQQYRDNPIPADQPFILQDEQAGLTELMFPGDPSGPPSATINCRCRSNTVHPAIGVVGSPLDARIAAELKRREEAD